MYLTNMNVKFDKLLIILRCWTEYYWILITDKIYKYKITYILKLPSILIFGRNVINNTKD